MPAQHTMVALWNSSSGLVYTTRRRQQTVFSPAEPSWTSQNLQNSACLLSQCIYTNTSLWSRAEQDFPPFTPPKTIAVTDFHHLFPSSGLKTPLMRGKNHNFHDPHATISTCGCG